VFGAEPKVETKTGCRTEYKTGRETSCREEGLPLDSGRPHKG